MDVRAQSGPEGVVHVDEHVVIAKRAGCVAVVFRGENRAGITKQLGDLTRQAFAEFGGRVGTVVAVEASAQTPDTEQRRAYADAMNDVEGEVAVFTQCVLATGFRGAAYRATMSTLQLLSRPKVPSMVVAGMGEAAAAIDDAIPNLPYGRHELEAWLEALRQL